MGSLSLDQSRAGRLEIHLLGSFRLIYAARPLPPFPTRAAKLLFSYLALHRRKEHAREALSAMLWGDCLEREARRKLRTELWRMRQTLAEGVPGVEFLVIHQNWVGLDSTQSLWIDVEEFERQIRAAERLRPDDPLLPTLLEEAAGLYSGDLLEGEYESWCLVEQDRLRALRLEVLERLLEIHISHKRWNHALGCGRKLLRHDPLVEHVHRQMMALHYLAGDRPRALRQFETCKEVLERELSVRPMHRTIELYEALRSEDTARLRALIGMAPEPPRELPYAGDEIRSRVSGKILAQGTLSELQEAADDLVKIRTKLLRGIRALSRRPQRSKLSQPDEAERSSHRGS